MDIERERIVMANFLRTDGGMAKAVYATVKPYMKDPASTAKELREVVPPEMLPEFAMRLAADLVSAANGDENHPAFKHATLEFAHEIRECLKAIVSAGPSSIGEGAE